MKTINVGLIGSGTVGSGVVKMLLESPSTFAGKLDREIVLRGVADRSIDKKKELNLPHNIVVTQDADEILNNPEINIVVELIGGIHPAKENGKTAGFVAGNLIHDMNGVIGHNINFVSVTAGYADIT